MRVRLTDITVRNLKASPGAQALFWDASTKAFGVRCSQAGGKSYIIKHQNQFITLGKVGVISLAQARDKAKRLLAEKVLGISQHQALSLEDALTLFFANCENRVRPRTLEEYQRLLTRHFAPFFKRPLTGIQTAQLAAAVDSLTNTPTEQNHAFAAMRTFLRFCVRRGLLARSPLEGMPLPSRNKARDRVLSDEELAGVIKAARKMGHPFGTIVLLCICTGQRKGEIAALRPEWIDANERTITIPAAIAKNNRAHTFPYGTLTEQLVEQLPFKGINWDRRTEQLRELAAIPHFTLHDLRRTFATNLAALGVPIGVTEKLLNHISGSLGGIVGVYQRHTFMEEMRDAIARWDNKLQTLLSAST
jgi:integrase